ncbi:MAG: transglycosylase SLT domain-containing protein [SAR324 cluster bacterium]|nr:transglycosylase SLT domain-containing protein [SAR324 cluster bacterium]
MKHILTNEGIRVIKAFLVINLLVLGILLPNTAVKANSNNDARYFKGENLSGGSLEKNQRLPASQDKELTEVLSDKTTTREGQGMIEVKYDQALSIPYLSQTGDVVIYENRAIKDFIRLYTKRKRKVFQKALSRYNIYMPTIRKIFLEYGLPIELSNLAIIESNLNYKAVSKAGAVGLWQFMASTGKSYGLESNIYYDDRLNVRKATHAAARHLKDLYNTFHNWELALAAYNTGTGNVRKAIRRNKRAGKKLDFWSLPLARETRGYVPAFFAVNIILNDLSLYGFNPDSIDNTLLPFDYPTKQIKVKGSVSFKQIERKLGVASSVLGGLNPEYKFAVTPPFKKNYYLNVPEETRLNLVEVSALKAEPFNFLITHKIRSGDNFHRIAKKYNTSVSKLRKLNPNINPRRLRVGGKLVLTTDRPAKVRYVSSTVYLVTRGDSLSKIADSFGISLRRLLNLNKNVSTRKPLQIGTRLTIR